MDILKELGVSVDSVERNSETDVEHKITIPFLQKILGFTKENGADFKFRVSRNVPIGSRFEQIMPDIAVYLASEPFLMVESKPINKTIGTEDMNEAVSNGRLYDFPKQFPYSVVSTGLKWETYDTLSGLYLGDHEAIPDVYRAKKILQDGVPLVPQAKRSEALRLKETRRLIRDRQELQALFKECKTRIEAEGKHEHDALAEISKIILAKIYEEETSVKKNRTYRFSLSFINNQIKAYPHKNATDILNEIFAEANNHYKASRITGIFPDKSQITLSYGTTKRIVELLQDYQFYEGGEDIKGVVYETFLKTLFRGSFGQYFTPREVIQFMIHLADPKPGERIGDPACGSGGFLIHSFLEVKKKILGMKISQQEKEDRIKKLLEQDLWGLDVAETLVQFCKINLITHGDGYRNIFKQDSLNKKEAPLSQENEKFDLIFTNPPFDLPSEHLEHIIDDYVLFKQHGYNGADVLFLERCYELLKPGGRLAIVVPHRFIDGTQFKNLRRWILDNMIPRAIVVLPVGIFKPFGGSNARTSVMYLRKPKNGEERTGHTLLSTVQFVGFETGIGEYKLIPENELEDLAVSQRLLDLKSEEEDIHGIHGIDLR